MTPKKSKSSRKRIDEFKSGAYYIKILSEKLIKFARELGEEEQRAIEENLFDEELVVFDLLTKPELDLNKKEVEEVKKVTKDLLGTSLGTRLSFFCIVAWFSKGLLS